MKIPSHLSETYSRNIPAFVFRDGMTADKGYVEWLSDVKARFRQSQIKASVRVNTSMLELYWSIGRDLVALRAEERWETGVVKQFALDMRQAFPNEKGFSHTNVKYMRQWYSFYYDFAIKSHQLGDQLTLTEKSHQLGVQLEMPEAFGNALANNITRFLLELGSGFSYVGRQMEMKKNINNNNI